MTECPSCLSPVAVTMHHTHRIDYRSSSRLIEWDECWSCHSKAEARAEQLKQEAERERQAKTPSRTRKPTDGPFALQLDGAGE